MVLSLFFQLGTSLLLICATLASIRSCVAGIKLGSI
jgi:hypothetical protein